MATAVPKTAYVNAFAVELDRRGVASRREVPTEVSHLGVPIGRYRVDMIVADRVLVDVKPTRALSDADSRHSRIPSVFGHERSEGQIVRVVPVCSVLVRVVRDRQFSLPRCIFVA